MKQTVRIIGGLYRGKKLSFPTIPGLRPTPDRVKETLFNWLMFDIQGARCLDAFAGSGALGFEACSRGASQCVMIESSSIVYTNLRKMAAMLQKADLTIIQDDARHYLHHTTASFDIVFLDPPFASNYLAECIELLATTPRLVSGGLLYLESASAPIVDERFWSLRKTKKAGQVYYALYEKR